MKRKLLLSAISFAALCFSAAPARADLFNFSVHSPDMTYDGTTFDADFNSTLSVVNFTRQEAPGIGTVNLGAGTSGDFTMSMVIAAIDNTPGSENATGTGAWTLTDAAGDTIHGTVAGTWSLLGTVPIFGGALPAVSWNNESGDNDFDGDAASVSMSYPTSPQPWDGTLIELTASGAAWFGGGAWLDPTGGPLTVTGGSIDAHVVPVPAAVLLGMLGLSVAGIKLRKFA